MNKFIVRISDLAVVLAITAAFFYGILIKTDPQVRVNSEVYHKASDYQKVAAESFKEYNNRTKLTVDEQEIINKLITSYPEISSAAVHLPLFGRTPRVDIAVAPPGLFLQSDGETYVVGANGKIIGKSATFAQVKNIPAVNDQSGYEAKVGEQVLSSQAAVFINTLIAQLKASKIEIESITLPPLAHELHMRPANSSYFVKFFLNGTAPTQIGQYLSTKKYLEANNISPLEYVDARVEGKVFYK